MIAHDNARERAELARLESEFPALLKTSDAAKSAFSQAIAAVEENASARARLASAIAQADRDTRAESERARKAAVEAAYPTTRAGYLTPEALQRALAAIRAASYAGEPGSIPFLDYDLQIVAGDEHAALAIYRHVVMGGPKAEINAKVRELEQAGCVTAIEARRANEKPLLFGNYP